MRHMTEKQRYLIECMNEWCREKFDFKKHRGIKDASDYINRNYEEYVLTTSYFSTSGDFLGYL